MKKISVGVAVACILFLIGGVAIAEFVLGDTEHASVYLDPYKKVMLRKMDDARDDPQRLVSCIHEAIHNQPFIYRQVLFMALFGALLATCFVLVLLPSMHPVSFFPMFLVLLFVFFLELAFLHFHYYQQKEEMVKYGLGLLPPVVPIS